MCCVCYVFNSKPTLIEYDYFLIITNLKKRNFNLDQKRLLATFPQFERSLAATSRLPEALKRARQRNNDGVTPGLTNK